MANLQQDLWRDWMILAQKGDKKSYRQLLEQLQIWLRGYFTRRAHPSIVEDLVQDCLLAIHNKRQTYDINREFGPWLAAIARHKLIDSLRRNLKFLASELDEEMIGQENNALCARYDVQNLLKFLPQKQAQIIEMVKLHEFSIEETAQKFGVSPSFVKVAIHRGIKTMQANIKGIANE